MEKSDNTLIIVPYNEEWVKEFQRIREFLLEHIGDIVIRIDHIGSTSVEGLAARPIIDIDVVIDSYNIFQEIVLRLSKIGFVHEGDFGVKGQEVFKRIIPDDFMDCHLYVCLEYGSVHLEHIKFRDYLREHPNVANEYAIQKQWATQQYEGNQESYAGIKTYFINGVICDTDMPETLIIGNRISIRKACIKDAYFISSTEADPDNSPWVANWPLRWRISKSGDNDFLQTIVELKDGTPIGFIIFRNMIRKDEQIELKRIALINAFKNKGYGKEILYLAQKLVFEIFGTQKLYLSTKTENIRAQNIYKATGFTLEEPEPCTHFHMKRDDYTDI